MKFTLKCALHIKFSHLISISHRVMKLLHKKKIVLAHEWKLWPIFLANWLNSRNLSLTFILWLPQSQLLIVFASHLKWNVKTGRFKCAINWNDCHFTNSVFARCNLVVGALIKRKGEKCNKSVWKSCAQFVIDINNFPCIKMRKMWDDGHLSIPVTYSSSADEYKYDKREETFW